MADPGFRRTAGGLQDRGPKTEGKFSAVGNVLGAKQFQQWAEVRTMLQGDVREILE